MISQKFIYNFFNFFALPRILLDISRHIHAISAREMDISHKAHNTWNIQNAVALKNDIVLQRNGKYREKE